MKQTYFLLFCALCILFIECKNSPIQPYADPKSFHGSVWKQEIQDGNPPVTYVKLRADGEFGYNYASPTSFNFDDDDTWTVKDSSLLLIWTGGYCIDTFPLDKAIGDVLFGIQSVDRDPIRMKRIR